MKKFLDLINLIKPQTIDIYILLKIVIVYKEKHFLFTVFPMILLGLKNFNNS